MKAMSTNASQLLKSCSPSEASQEWKKANSKQQFNPYISHQLPCNIQSVYETTASIALRI